MYNDIGGMIKGLAKGLFVLGLIASVVAGVGLLLKEEEFIVFALLVWVAGPLGSWVSSCFIYGFGEIIESLQEIAENTSPATVGKMVKTAQKEPKPSKGQKAHRAAKAPVEELEEECDESYNEEELPLVKCPECHKEHDFDYPKCPHCGHKYEQ